MKLDPRMLTANASVTAPMLTWVTVHGNLCLSLRHPSNVGQSRELCLQMVEHLSKLIVDAGIMTQEEMDFANRVEQEHGSNVGGPARGLAAATFAPVPVPEGRKPVAVRCSRCEWVFVGMYTPMGIDASVTVMKHMTCPMCACRKILVHE